MGSSRSANLGLATTEQLMRELMTRFAMTADYPSIDRALVLAEMLGRLPSNEREYSTVGRDD